MPGLCPGRRAAVAAALAPVVLVVLAGVLGQALYPGRQQDHGEAGWMRIFTLKNQGEYADSPGRGMITGALNRG